MASVITLILSLSLAACGSNNAMGNGTRQPERSATPNVNTQTATKLDEDSTKEQKAADKKLKITIGESVVTVTLNNNKTTQDFISLLPLTLTMNDLWSREKFAHLPRAISEEGGTQTTMK